VALSISSSNQLRTGSNPWQVPKRPRPPEQWLKGRPFVSNGMRSHRLGLSGSHLYTAPPLWMPGWPDSAAGAPTSNLKYKRMIKLGQPC